MNYYVMYQDAGNNTRYDIYFSAKCVCDFINEKMADDGLELTDFTVVQGTPLDLREEVTRKIYLTN